MRRTARDDLKPFPDSDDKETLVLIADFVVDRDAKPLARHGRAASSR
jgi:hypothetical protein